MPRTSFLIFCLMFFTVSFGVAAMAALIPSMASYFKISTEAALPLTWLYMLPYGVFALIWAPLTRVIKLKKILIWTTLGFCLASLAFSLSTNIRQALVFRFFMGCMGCSFVPLALITIGKAVPVNEKSRYIGIFFGISYVSTFISVFLSGFLPWRILYLIPALLALFVSALIVRYLDDFDFTKTRFKISYLDTLKNKQALSFFIVIMLGSFLYHSLQQRLGVYLSQTYSLTQVVISSIFAVAMLSAMIFEFGGGALCARFGNIKISRLGFILMSVFALFLIFVKDYQKVFFLIIFWGSGWALTHVGLSSHLAHFPDKILRDAASLNSSLRFSFGGLGAFLGGALVSVIGFKAFFIAIAVSVFFLGFYLNKIINGRKECYG